MPTTCSTLISVIIPVYNAEKWIHQSYGQVAKQTYPHLEIVYIDNNSTDQSLEIIKKLAVTDKRIVWFEEMKKGAGAARNTGMRNARGSILSFLDVDDKIEPDKIARHVEILTRYPKVQLIYGKELKVYEDTNKSYEIPTDPGSPGPKEKITLAIHWLEVFSRLPGMSSVTCRKDAALSVDGFQENLLRGEDAAFFIKMALHFTCYYDDQKVGEYYRHPDSSTSSDNREQIGNPYYYQFKEFYLPYLTVFSKKTGNRKLLRFVSQKTAQSLLSHALIKCNSVKERNALISTELRDIKGKGLHYNHYLTTMVLAMCPKSLAKILIYVWSAL